VAVDTFEDLKGFMGRFVIDLKEQTDNITLEHVNFRNEFNSRFKEMDQLFMGSLNKFQENFRTMRGFDNPAQIKQTYEIFTKQTVEAVQAMEKRISGKIETVEVRLRDKIDGINEQLEIINAKILNLEREKRGLKEGEPDFNLFIAHKGTNILRDLDIAIEKEEGNITYKDLGAKFSFTGSRAREIHQKWIRRIRHGTTFLAYGKEGEELDALKVLKDYRTFLRAKSPSELSFESLLEEDVSVLDIPSRTRNCLGAECINTIQDLINWEERELIRTPNLGQKSINELKEKLAAHGLSLKKSD